jgi:hypothetical protein
METDLEPKDHPDPLIEAKQKKLVKWKRRCGRIVGKPEIMRLYQLASGCRSLGRNLSDCQRQISQKRTSGQYRWHVIV